MSSKTDPNRWVTYGEFETAFRQYQVACQAFNSKVFASVGVNAAVEDELRALAADVKEKRSRYVALSEYFLS